MSSVKAGVSVIRTANGEEAVLKTGGDMKSEIDALRLYCGGAAVRVLDYDADRGFLVLERLQPGEPLTSLRNDEMETRIAAQTMRELWRPLPSSHSFATSGDWADGMKALRNRFQGGTGPFPQRLVETAETLFAELLSSSEPSVLLHGDLHHFNILSAQRRPWVAIDPKGLAGERAYDVGALLRNPDPTLCTNVEVQRRRIAVLREELQFDPQRMVGWGVAQAVLSAWWSFEDGEEWESACACAETLAKL